MTIIPDPPEAARLRVLYRDNPVVDRACAALSAHPDLHVRDAVRLLEHWAHSPELSWRERRAVLARYVPLPAERCSRCGYRIAYVTDGPDPGWWRHVEPTDQRAMHSATPDYSHLDPEHGNSGPGGRIFPRSPR